MKIDFTKLLEEIGTEMLPLAQLEHNEGQIEGLPRNPREWTQDDIDETAASIEETPGMMIARPLMVTPGPSGRFVILGGNLRLEALRVLGAEVAPCAVFPEGTAPEVLQAIVIKDNTSKGKWDWDMLANEWPEDKLALWGVPVWDTDPDGVVEIGAEDETPEDVDQETAEDDFDEDADQVPARVCAGDVWKLGNHRLLCGDSCSAEDVARLLDGQEADLVFTDPPYGMKKEIDGVLNDNQNADELLEFNRAWVPLSFDALKANGSWYCWGCDEGLFDIYAFILRPLVRRSEIAFRNYITWAKHSCKGVNWDGARSYPKETEKCLFVMKGCEGFNNNADHYDDTFEPIRAYLEGEAKRMKINNKLLQSVCGCSMYSHWFTKSQFAIIPENHYKELQAHFQGEAFLVPYPELREMFDKSQHDSIKAAQMAKRAYFDNTHNSTEKNDIMTDVWRFCATTTKERQESGTGGHATPKPLALCERGILSSSREGELVLDLFGGSGSTLIACEQLGRRCCIMELDPHYCDVILARWEKATGGKAEKVL